MQVSILAKERIVPLLTVSPHERFEPIKILYIMIEAEVEKKVSFSRAQ